jgi:hypothetical protein
MVEAAAEMVLVKKLVESVVQEAEADGPATLVVRPQVVEQGMLELEPPLVIILIVVVLEAVQVQLVFMIRDRPTTTTTKIAQAAATVFKTI